VGAPEFAAEPDAAIEKARLISEALDTLRTAQQLDERESLDRASWVVWYDATIPQVRDLRILAGAMEIELHRRRGERSTPLTQCVSKNAAEQQLSRDRTLAALPDRVTKYIQHEAAAGHVPSLRGAIRVVKAMLPKTDRKTGQFTASQQRAAAHADDVIAKFDAVADGERRTDEQLTKAGLDDVPTLLKRARLLPWLAIDRTAAGTTFVIDVELRAICEARAPRPALGHQSIRAYLHHLRDEITRRRKENHDDFRKRKWNSELILKREQTALLDWIEEQLMKVPN
jgi:hypothetical protein